MATKRKKHPKQKTPKRNTQTDNPFEALHNKYVTPARMADFWSQFEAGKVLILQVNQPLYLDTALMLPDIMRDIPDGSYFYQRYGRNELGEKTKIVGGVCLSRHRCPDIISVDEDTVEQVITATNRDQLASWLCGFAMFLAMRPAEPEMATHN